MAPNTTVRLLIVHDSRTEAERLISMLNNAGRSTRAQHVDSEDALVKLLQEQTWELAIADTQARQLTAAALIRQIKRLNKDVPVILQTETEGSHPVVEGLRLGAADVVHTDDDQHLLLVLARELDNREQRQAKRKAERRFKEAEKRSQQLLDSSRDAVAYIQDGMFLYANQSFAEAFGYADPDDLLGVPAIDLVAKPDQEATKQFLKEFTLKGADAESTEFGFKAQGGGQVNFEVAHATFDEEPCIQLLMHATKSVPEAEVEEVVEAKVAEITAEMKQKDPATGLYSRQFFLKQLEAAVDRAADGQGGTLTYIEIDHFADRVEAAHGASLADAVIQQLVKLLVGHCRPDELLARFGDNTFTILSPGAAADKLLARAQALVAGVAETVFDVDGTTLQLTLSAGLALVTEASSDAEQVIDQALSAVASLHQASTQAGVGNGACLFEPKSEGAEQDMARAVQRAVDQNRFKLLFQPIISLRGNDTEHYEVLLRMLDEAGHQVSPTKFLEAAEEVGASAKIDRWVILEAIKMLSEHRARGNNTALVVNLSRHSLTDEGLLPWLGVAFKAAKLPASALLFQVRELDVINHLNAAKAFCAGLAKLQSNLCIANFGCAMNHFTTLRHVPAHYIKIDGSFTQDVQSGNASSETLTNMIRELHKLEKITLVPFVENANVLSTLWQSGVHYIQGHYLQGPTEGMDYDFNMDG